MANQYSGRPATKTEILEWELEQCKRQLGSMEIDSKELDSLFLRLYKRYCDPEICRQLVNRGFYKEVIEIDKKRGTDTIYMGQAAIRRINEIDIELSISSEEMRQ